MKHVLFYLSICLLCVSCGTLSISEKKSNTLASKNSFEFALIGDTPYGVEPEISDAGFDDLRREINQDQHIKWVLHAGDIKSGSSPCSDEMLIDRLQRFNNFNKPVIYTPGDNEWTDCHRQKAGSYLPLERLEKLRKIFFSTPGMTLGKNIKKVETQADTKGYEDFPENVRWVESNIVFFTLHIVGSKNGLQEFDRSSTAVRSAADDDEVQQRTRAALDWMKSSFALANNISSPGVFLMIHANPGIDAAQYIRKAYEPFLKALENHIKIFNKPVLLAHGDTHHYRVDSPALYTSNKLPNFTRVETHGPLFTDWIRIRVNPSDNKVFVIE